MKVPAAKLRQVPDAGCWSSAVGELVDLPDLQSLNGRVTRATIPRSCAQLEKGQCRLWAVDGKACRPLVVRDSKPEGAGKQ